VNLICPDRISWTNNQATTPGFSFINCIIAKLATYRNEEKEEKNMEDFDEIDDEWLELFNKDKLLSFLLYYC
jgi:hypothetical protein